MSFDLELINNDLSIKTNGEIRTITDTPKLRQDIIKIILTPLGSVINHPWYGCVVSEDIIGKNLPDHITNSQISAAISQSLDRLKTLQKSQSATQKMSLAEIIDAVGEVFVERDSTDPRKLNIIITVLTKRLTKIEELFTIIS